MESEKLKVKSEKWSRKQNLRFAIIAAVIAVVAVAVDLITKSVFDKLLVVSESVIDGQRKITSSKTLPFLGNYITFNFTLNYGASFGMFQGQNGLFFALTLLGIPLFGLFAWFSRKESLLGAYGIALVLGGIIGNAADRAFLGSGFFNGGVRDFVAVNALVLSPYVCNFADICINVGVAIYIIGMLFVGKGAIFRKKKKPDEPAGDRE